MNEILAALALVIADLRKQLAVTEAQNEQLRKQLAEKPAAKPARKRT